MIEAIANKLVLVDPVTDERKSVLIVGKGIVAERVGIPLEGFDITLGMAGYGIRLSVDGVSIRLDQHDGVLHVRRHLDG